MRDTQSPASHAGEPPGVAPPGAPPDAARGLYGADGQLQFFQDPAMDRFVAVVLKLTQELWVMSERVDMLERLSAESRPFLKEQVDTLLADPQLIAAREAGVGEFVNRILRPLREP